MLYDHNQSYDQTPFNLCTLNANYKYYCELVSSLSNWSRRTSIIRTCTAAILSKHTWGNFSKMPDVCINSHPNIRNSVSVSEFNPSHMDGVNDSLFSGMRTFSNVILTRLKSRTKLFTSAISLMNRMYIRRKNISVYNSAPKRNRVNK